MTAKSTAATPSRTGRRVFAGVSAATFSALFITPSALLPGAEVTPLLVVVGLAMPAGVAGLTLALTEDRIRRDLVPADRRPQPATAEEAMTR